MGRPRRLKCRGTGSNRGRFGLFCNFKLAKSTSIFRPLFWKKAPENSITELRLAEKHKVLYLCSQLRCKYIKISALQGSSLIESLQRVNFILRSPVDAQYYNDTSSNFISSHAIPLFARLSTQVLQPTNQILSVFYLLPLLRGTSILRYLT